MATTQTRARGTRSRRSDALIAAWLAGLASERTRAAYARDMAAFGAWCAARGRPTLAVTPDDVRRYRDECSADGASPSTVARRLSAVSSFYRHAVDARAVSSNPVEPVPRPDQPNEPRSRVLPDADAAALYDAAVELGPKVATLVALLLLDGMKLGEALALDVRAVRSADDDDRGAPAVATITRRGERHDIGLDARTAGAIAEYLGGRRRGPLLLGDSPTQPGLARLTRFGADFLLKRASDRAGIEPPVSANTLRRTYITRALREGVPVAHVQRHVGHADERDTRRYSA